MFKKLKSLFVVEDEGGDKLKKSEVSKDVKSSESSKTKSRSTSEGHFKPDAKSSSKFVDVLLKAIEANNLEGFDYLEYKQALQNLAKMAMDEQTRYQSAFAMAQTMGVTPAKLKQSAEHYLKILNAEELKFQDALKNQKNKQIVEKQKAVTQLDNIIKQKAKQIEQLKAEMVKHTKQLESHKKSMTGAAEKVEKTRINFESAYVSVTGQIKVDLEKMKQYLK
jgi:hypothetical protein